MKKILFIAIISIIGFMQVNAQLSNLVVFTNEGSPFILVCNGIPLNEEPATNVKLVGVNKGSFRVKIIFENSNYNEIEKDLFARVDTQSVYIVKTKRKGKKVIRFYDKKRIIRDEYGNQINDISGQGQVVVIVNEYEPYTGDQTNNYIPPNNNYVPNQNELPPCNAAMHQVDFQPALISVQNTDFESDKLVVAKQIVMASCLTSKQVKKIVAVFHFEKTKLDFAKFAYPRTIDPNNYYIINSVFEFSSSIRDLNAYIDSITR